MPQAPRSPSRSNRVRRPTCSSPPTPTGWITRSPGSALTLVARGEAALGIVYSTDARVERGVKIVGTFPPDSHPAIVYPVAATTTAKPETADYLAFLRSTAARNIFEKYGFKFLLSPTT